jgi:CubicO group peptidase (beta-lactamase class C family)
MSDTEELTGLDTFLEDALNQWKTPGTAVVILKNREIIYTKGFGYRDMGNSCRMTPHTIHPIASCTKAFTSTACAMLVDEGVLEWDTPIRKFIPKFSLKDSFASAKITLIDMLSHRTGLPRHDFVWLHSDFTYDQVLDRLPFLKLSKDLRTTFQYNNLMYLAASVIIEEISGVKYNQFIADRILKPLGMSHANFSLTDMQKAPDFAKPYRERNNELEELEFINNDVASGAGCINASIEDMGKWLQFHLNKGKVGDNQIVSSDNLKKTHDPVIIISPGSGLDFWVPDQKWIQLQTYGLGWGGEIYRGTREICHEGGIDGSTSRMSFLPDEGIGVGVIVNKSDSFMPSMVTYSILDRLVGLDAVDWNGLLKKIDDKSAKTVMESQAKSQELQVLNTNPTHALKDYAGKYYHPGYGVIEVFCDKGVLKAALGNSICPLDHFHFDTFQFFFERFSWRDLLTFQTDPGGEVVGFTVKLEAHVAPVLFDRLPDEYMRDKEFLKAFVGKYELEGAVVEVALKENILTFALPGQPPSELVPVRGLRFKLKDSEAAIITFKQDSSKTVSEFLFSQFGAVISAKRIE